LILFLLLTCGHECDQTKDINSVARTIPMRHNTLGSYHTNLGALFTIESTACHNCMPQ
jgi:hypothetical protein